MAQTPCFCFLTKVLGADEYHSLETQEQQGSKLRDFLSHPFVVSSFLSTNLPSSLPTFSWSVFFFIFSVRMGNCPDTEIRASSPFTFQVWHSSWNQSSLIFANWTAGTGDLERGSGWVLHSLAEERRASALETLEKSVGEQRGRPLSGDTLRRCSQAAFERKHPKSKAN